MLQLCSPLCHFTFFCVSIQKFNISSQVSSIIFNTWFFGNAFGLEQWMKNADSSNKIQILTFSDSDL